MQTSTMPDSTVTLSSDVWRRIGSYLPEKDWVALRSVNRKTRDALSSGSSEFISSLRGISRKSRNLMHLSRAQYYGIFLMANPSLKERVAKYVKSDWIPAELSDSEKRLLKDYRLIAAFKEEYSEACREGDFAKLRDGVLKFCIYYFKYKTKVVAGKEISAKTQYNRKLASSADAQQRLRIYVNMLLGEHLANQLIAKEGFYSEHGIMRPLSENQTPNGWYTMSFRFLLGALFMKSPHNKLTFYEKFPLDFQSLVGDDGPWSEQKIKQMTRDVLYIYRLVSRDPRLFINPSWNDDFIIIIYWLDRKNIDKFIRKLMLGYLITSFWKTLFLFSALILVTIPVGSFVGSFIKAFVAYLMGLEPKIFGKNTLKSFLFLAKAEYIFFYSLLAVHMIRWLFFIAKEWKDVNALREV